MSRIIVDELVTLIGAEVDKASPVNVEKFKGQLIVLGAAALDIAGKVWTFGQRLNASVLQSGAASLSLDQLSKRTSLSAKSIQELGYAVVATGGNIASLQGDLDRLSMIKGPATMEQALQSYAEKFSKMSALNAQYFGQSLGFSNDFIRLLQEGKTGIAALREEAVKMGAAWPEKLTKDAATWTKWLAGTNLAIRQTEDRIKIGLLPVLTRLTDRWREFLQNHGEEWGKKVLAVLEGVSSGAEDFGKTLTKIWDWLPVPDKLRSFMDDTNNLQALFHDLTEGGIPALGIALLALKFKWALLAADILAVTFALTELFKTIQGHVDDTVLGGLMNRYIKLAEKVFGVDPDTMGNFLNMPDAGKTNEGKPFSILITPEERIQDLGDRPGHWLIGGLNPFGGHFLRGPQETAKAQKEWDAQYNWIAGLGKKPASYKEWARTVVPTPAAGPTPKMITNNVPVTQNFYGPADPQVVRSAAAGGVRDALDSNGLGTNAPTAR